MDTSTYILATGLIFVVSVLFSMLGLGGGMLYVPIFKWPGFPLKAVAIPLGLLLNGVTTLSAFLRYTREGLVDFRGGLPAAISGLVLAPVGARMVEYVPQHALLLLFALMVTVAGIRTLVKSSQGEPEQMASPTRRDQRLHRHLLVVLGLSRTRRRGPYRPAVGRPVIDHGNRRLPARRLVHGQQGPPRLGQKSLWHDTAGGSRQAGYRDPRPVNIHFQ